MLYLFLVLICVMRSCNVLRHVTARYRSSFYYYYYYYYSLITVLIHNSGHFGPPLPFWAPRYCSGLPMVSYATVMHSNFNFSLVKFAKRHIGAYQRAWILWWFCRLHCGPVVPWCLLHTYRHSVCPQPVVRSCWKSNILLSITSIYRLSLFEMTFQQVNNSVNMITVLAPRLM